MQAFWVLPGDPRSGAKDPEFHLAAVVKANATGRMQQPLQQAGVLKSLNRHGWRPLH